MNTKRGYLLLAVLAVAALVILSGCKKKEEPAAPTEMPSMEEMTKKATEAVDKMDKEAAAAEKMAASMEQTTCPVMDGNKIDKNIFVEYKGKKVYFCCAGCKAKFEAEPEKYLPELPQFQQ